MPPGIAVPDDTLTTESSFTEKDHPMATCHSTVLTRPPLLRGGPPSGARAVLAYPERG